MNLIDKDVVLKHLDMCLAETDNDTPIVDATLRAIKCYIEDAPTVDAEPVRHGRWIEMERGHYFKCSLCRNPIPYKFGWRLYNGVILNKRYYNYCPNCGAKMDGERKDNGEEDEDAEE